MTAASPSQLHIDWTRCDGRGLCAEILDRALGRDDWGYPVVLRGDPEHRTDLVLRQEELTAADEAVALCPVAALRLTQAGVR